MAEASAAVERRKASASRWTRGRARRAFGGNIRCVAWPHGTVAPFRRSASLYFFGGKRPVALVGKTRTRTASREREYFPPPRKRGRGTTGARVASEPWWRGRRTRSFVVAAGSLLAQETSEHVWRSQKTLRGALVSAPPPPPCFAGWSPSPAIAVADGDGDRHAAPKVPRHFNRFFFQYAVTRAPRGSLATTSPCAPHQTAEARPDSVVTTLPWWRAHMESHDAVCEIRRRSSGHLCVGDWCVGDFRIIGAGFGSSWVSSSCVSSSGVASRDAGTGGSFCIRHL